MSQSCITNAQIPGYQGLQYLIINPQGTIADIAPMATLAATNRETLDLAGDWLSLGGVDLQINGALGLAFPDLEKSHLPQLQKICDFLWEQGVDSFLPTIVTTAPEKIHQALSVIAEFTQTQQSSQPTAKIIGVHLEGPFLNQEKRGAHPQEYLLPLTIDKVKQVLGDYASLVKIITLAPELDPTQLVISYLRDLGIIVSLGHSLATATQAQQAFSLGATMVTHAFNAMPKLHHRAPGLLGEAIIEPQVYCGLIADGNHVCPTMMQILLQASDYEKGIFLVSDALAPLGLADGTYPWDCREIEVTQGTARLGDGTLAGTTLPLLAGVQNLVHWGLCTVEQGIAMATESPRYAIDLPGISIGQPANLLRWHWQPETSHLSWQRLVV